jgi:phosphonatase-like hydrolase
MKIEMVAFDIAGTTLNDDGVVIQAFKRAFASTQPGLWPTYAEKWTKYAFDTMGQSKIQVFTELLGDAEKAAQANVAFEDAYIVQLEEFRALPIPGAEEQFKTLRSKGVAVALTTGFSRSTLDTLLDRLQWRGLIDIAVSPSEVEQGRPYPDMLIHAAAQLGITSPANCVVLGDTAADMQAAIAFGASEAIGVLTGAHRREVLIDAGATSVIHSVADFTLLN